MEVFSSIEDARGRLDGCAVAIGNFDGVHLGHQRLLQTVKDQAALRGGPSVLLTFEPHPARVLSPEFAPQLIASPARKLQLLEDSGISAVVFQPFDRAYAAGTPEAFARSLVETLGARDIVVGHDFTFGKNRAGTSGLLASLTAPQAQVHVVPAVTSDGLPVSSSKIRELILEGRVGPAARLLGRPFILDGVVVPGRGRGRTIGVPTANVAPATELLPASGVYTVICASDAFTGMIGGAANIGVKPTFGGGDLTVEVHLFGEGFDLYGHGLSVGFLARLRGEERFDGPQALVAQIRRDIEKAHTILDEGDQPVFPPIMGGGGAA